MQKIRIVIAGDLLPSNENISLFEAGNVKQLFGDKLCELFRGADISIVNLEGPLTDATQGMEKDGPVIKAPMSTAKGLKELGISLVALANNHITDYLQKGYVDTVNTLKQIGVQYVGAGPNVYNIKKHHIFQVGEIRICIYNVSETFFNIPGKDCAGANLYDEYVVCNDIKELKRTYDYVLVLYHGGSEYFPYPTPQTRQRFHRMADCGADFITAQHTHCIGCAELYKGSYLLYGQGNFLFARQRNFPHLTKEGLVTELIIDENGMHVINHLVRIEGSIIRLADHQDLTSFYERGTHLDDDDYLISLFKEMKSKEIMNKYLLSYKGHFPMYRLIRHLFPKSFNAKGLMNSYSKNQCLQNISIIQGERRYEDMYYVWQYIMGTKQ